MTLRLLNEVAIASTYTGTRDGGIQNLRVPAGKYLLKFEHDAYEIAYLGAKGAILFKSW